MSREERRRKLFRVLALGSAAIVMLVPANVLPVMFMQRAGETPIEPTIIAGVRLLADDGLWGLAAIVFIASLAVPFFKLAGLAVLCRKAWRENVQHPDQLTRVHAALDFIGRWSMLDVFLVAFLSGAVRFGPLVSVEPRSGIVAFALVVVLTMLATRAFDTRLLWNDVRASDAPHSA